jgi:hypothetical protein
MPLAIPAKKGRSAEDPEVQPICCLSNEDIRLLFSYRRRLFLINVTEISYSVGAGDSASNPYPIPLAWTVQFRAHYQTPLLVSVGRGRRTPPRDTPCRRESRFQG